MSWNGATEVATWRLETWNFGPGEHIDEPDRTGDVIVLQEYAKSGFETEILIPAQLDSPMFRLDATARYYIKRNIQQKAAVRDLKNSGAVGKYLMSRYEWTMEYDMVILVQRIAQWKKDPKVDIEASLQQLEQLNADLYKVSNQKHKFDELMILAMFLNRLPEEYGTRRDSLFSNATLERGLILSRLQQKES